MEIRKSIILLLDFISELCIFFMKLWIWPIFLYKEMSDSDGKAYQTLGALFIGLGTVCPLTTAYFYLNFEISLKAFIQIIILEHLIIGLMTHFILKKEFGESFLTLS